MSFELPPLGKFVIQSFDADSPAYPMVVVSRDPTIQGYVKPAVGAACPDPRYAGTHTFVSASVTHLDNRVLWLYRKLPGPMLVGRRRSQEIRGATVSIVTQEGASGTLTVDTGSAVLSSAVDPLSTVIDERKTESALDLPPAEVSGFWEPVGLPLLIFDIINTIYCNGGPFGTLVTNFVQGGGSSVLRKHRKTVSYDFGPTAPNPNLSGSAYTPTVIDYSGKIIHISKSDVLNDHITYDQDFIFSSSGSACGWTEAYDYPATTPSATAFAAGIWVTKSFVNEPWGDSGWKSTHIEYYSADGNPML